MTQELSGRVAIVTGAGRNIGRAIALALADGGAAVVVNARSNVQEAKAVAGEIERAGGKAFAAVADVADADAVARMVEQAASRFGRIDILVNNAGMNIRKPAVEVTWDDWNQIIDTNLRGAFFVAQAVAKGMIARYLAELPAEVRWRRMLDRLVPDQTHATLPR